MNKLLGLINALLVIAYPIAIWFGLTHFSPRFVAVTIICLAVLQLPFKLRGQVRENLGAILAVPAVVVGFATLGAIFDSPRAMLILPVLTNVALLVTFAGSLRATPLVERFARAMEPDLTPDKVAYCRTVTIVWSAFFVANGLTIALLAAFAPLPIWASYTGLGSYFLVGALMTGEYVVRKARFRTYGPSIQDRILSRVFPP